MVIPLRQSTAVTLKLGPFVDDADGKTAETGLSVTQSTVRLSKEGGAFAQKNEATTGTHDENGWYGIPLNATDTGTLGVLRIAIAISGALPVWETCQVLPAAVYDSLYAGSDNLQVDMVQLGGATQSATDLKDFADTGYDPATHKVQGVVLTDTVTTLTNAPSDPSGVTTLLARLTNTRATNLDNLDATISSRLATSAITLSSGGVVLAASQPLYAPAVAGDAMTLTSGERTAVANEVETQIIDETDAEKVLTAITDKIASVNPSLGDLSVAAIASAVVTAMQVDGTKLSTVHADLINGGRLDLLIDQILADTNELQTDWTNGGRLELRFDNLDDKLLVLQGEHNLILDQAEMNATLISAIPTAAQNADKILGRNIAGGSDGGRTVLQALAFLRNKVAISSGIMTVYTTDDATSLWTAGVTSSASADPITGVDPS